MLTRFPRMLYCAQRAYPYVGRGLKRARRRGAIVRRGWLILPLAVLALATLSCGQGAERQRQANDEKSDGGGAEVLWKKSLPGEYLWPLAVADGIVYGAMDSKVFALDTDTGETRWQRELGFDSYPCGGPAVGAGKVYVPARNGLRALDAESGDEVWSFEADGMSAPIVGGGLTYAGSEDGYVYAIDSQTGEQRWRFQVADSLVATPALGDGVLYVDGDPYVWALDAATGEERWRFRESEHTESVSPVVGLESVFVADIQYLYVLDTATGGEIWHRDIGGDLEPPPAVADGTLYIATSYDGTFHALDATTGEVRWLLRLDDDRAGHPLIVGDTLYVGGRSLYALDAGSGEELWRFDLETPEGGDGFVVPTVADGTVYATVCLDAAYESGCEEGNSYVYALRDSGRPSTSNKGLKPETPVPSPQPRVAAPPPTTSPRNLNATPPVLIDSPGVWTFSDLGYSDIWLDRNSGMVIDKGRLSRRYADPFHYALPAGASQGWNLQYTLHLHIEIILSDDVNTIDRGFQEFTVWATVGNGAVEMLEFSTVWEGDRLVVECDHQFDCKKTEQRDGDRLKVRLEGWPYANGIGEAGVQPGANSILFAIPYRDLPPRFEAWRIFDDSFIEVTTESPY